jgi:hypothetical protein
MYKFKKSYRQSFYNRQDKYFYVTYICFFDSKGLFCENNFQSLKWNCPKTFLIPVVEVMVFVVLGIEY